MEGPEYVANLGRAARTGRLRRLWREEDRRRYAELIVHGLAFSWLDSALERHFVRHTDSAVTPRPTPLAAFLAHAPWIPQTAVPGAPAEGTA
ncbi:hypothetical protein SPURM210S_06722 [Streptomyces purpurascens]|nr:hypothetical protein GCM10010303_09590 [Streptomyces purpurascens]